MRFSLERVAYWWNRQTLNSFHLKTEGMGMSKGAKVYNLMDEAHKRVLYKANRGIEHQHEWAVYSYGCDYEASQKANVEQIEASEPKSTKKTKGS